MLKVKTFNIKDDTGVNELLSKYRLANKPILVVKGFFNGYIMVPYEDGEPPTPVQEANDLKEELNELMAGKKIVVHSQDVNEQQLQEAETMLIVLSEDIAKEESAHPRKKLEERKKEVEDRISVIKNQIFVNGKELERMDMNIDRMQDKINALLASI